MQTTEQRNTLFANTGVQILCTPLSGRYKIEQTGRGWQRCRCMAQGKPRDVPYLQWQISPSSNQLLMAVDTTIGAEGEEDNGAGYFSKMETLGGDFNESIQGLLGADGEPLPGVQNIDFTIRPATAEGGEPRDVDVVVDFGNSRSGALLVEFRGDVQQEPLMTPMQLMNRYHLDAWDEDGALIRDATGWWFSSKTHWSTSPYLDAPRMEHIVSSEEEETTRGMFGSKTQKKTVERTAFTYPDTFQDFSMVRLGREADDLAMVMRIGGDVRTSVSSPKRYLWAKDAGWLEGAIWHMADPDGRFDADRHATPVKGPLLRYITEEDSDDQITAEGELAPPQPRHAPRVMMVAALYELLCQAYVYVNSPTYRRVSGDEGRMRRIRSLILTHPSGMIDRERERFAKQAGKAIDIFAQTLGRRQTVSEKGESVSLVPDLEVKIDEASAVHLTYIWSEVQKLGRKTSLWFSLVGNRQVEQQAEAKTEEEPKENDSSPVEEKKKSRPVRGTRPSNRPARPAQRERPAAGGRPAATPRELRIACIDIGGGTSDLMIAKYTCVSQPGGDLIQGETLHRDGISVAGDQLVKRLLEKVVVPKFQEVTGIENSDIQRLFGPEVINNREFRSSRINWMNRLLVPLAQRYLDNAVNGYDDEISHTDPDVVAADVLDQFEADIDRICGQGYYNVRSDLGLRYYEDEVEDVIYEVFQELIFDFSMSIVDHKADVVLLAGQPTKLQYLRELVEKYLPLPKSRIISMYERFAGYWYPYQNPDSKNPGIIVDPKSTVVVGAAIEFAARNGMLSQFKFKMSDRAAQESYYWGVMTESHIYQEHILFEKRGENEGLKKERLTFSVHDKNLTIGRKRRDYDDAQASPIYVLTADTGNRRGEIEVEVTLERSVSETGKEVLDVLDAKGQIAGEPAQLGENVFLNWRTLAHERYYLDTGGLDRIEFPKRVDHE